MCVLSVDVHQLNAKFAQHAEVRGHPVHIGFAAPLVIDDAAQDEIIRRVEVALP